MTVNIAAPTAANPATAAQFRLRRAMIAAIRACVAKYAAKTRDARATAWATSTRMKMASAGMRMIGNVSRLGTLASTIMSLRDMGALTMPDV